jgi:hypothetical protein
MTARGGIGGKEDLEPMIEEKPIRVAFGPNAPARHELAFDDRDRDAVLLQHARANQARKSGANNQYHSVRVQVD